MDGFLKTAPHVREVEKERPMQKLQTQEVSPIHEQIQQKPVIKTPGGRQNLQIL